MTALQIVKALVAAKETKEVQQRTAVPLSRAMLCADCETIFDHFHGSDCPGCASRVASPVARYLRSAA